MLNPHVINRALERIIRDCNAEETERAEQEHREPVLLPHFSAHNLRHTFCTRLCENETNLKVIQEIMGHRNIETTMDVYNEATKEKKMSSFANLEGKSECPKLGLTPVLTPIDRKVIRIYENLRYCKSPQNVVTQGL